MNAEWMMRFTFLLNKEHAIFHESYVPPKPIKPVEPVIDPHAAKFAKYSAATFANLPIPNRTGMKKQAVVSGAIAREKKPSKIQRVEAQLAAM